MNRFPKWVDINLQKNDADPWVIALAMRHDLIVVSNERHGGESKVKIPYVCEVFDVEHFSLDDFLREIGWQA